MQKGLTLFCALLLLMAGLVSGCSSSPNKTAAPPEANKADNTLVWGRGADSVSLDPAIATDEESTKVTVNIFDNLVEYAPDSTGVRGGLATDWTVSGDGLEWTFNLRQGVKFQDGADFNAAAVVTNIQRWMDKNNSLNNGQCKYWSYMFNGYTPDSIVSKVEATGDYQVKFTLRTPYAPFIQNLAMPYFAIASPAALTKYGADFAKNPVGTGPFKFVSWSTDGQITLTRNQSYWGATAKVNQLIFRSIPNASARFLALENGTIDIMDGANQDDVASAMANDRFQVLRRPAINVGYLAMNTEKKPFNNQQVRQAVNYAINKQAIINNFFGGLAQPAKNPLPPAWWGYNEQIKDYAYDPNKAKELLTQAGYPNGFKTTLWAMPVTRAYMPQGQKIAAAIQTDLAAVGIEANIVNYDWDTYLNKAENGEQDMLLMGWTGDNGDPDNFLYTLLDQDNAIKGSASNYAFYKNNQVHDLLLQAQRETEQNTRSDLYKQAQEIIHQDAPWAPLVHSTDPLVLMKYVQGLNPQPMRTEKLNTVSVRR